MPRHDGTVITHANECSIINSLLIDLKKRELGREHTPITIERIDEATAAIGVIQQCRKQAFFRGSR